MSQLPVNTSHNAPATVQMVGAAQRQGMPNAIPFLTTLASIGIGYGVMSATGAAAPMLAAGAIAGAVVGSIISTAFRVAAQWERALVFRLGKYVGTKGPGLFMVLPFFDSVRFVDMRILSLDIPRRQAISKDNVPLSLDGVIFLRVSDPSIAYNRVRDYENAIQQYAQSALRDIVGSMTLDQILADREEVGHRIESMVSTEIDGWGLDVAAIRIQDIELPEDLKRVMARQASAEREKRATITKAEGDRDAAQNLADAARTMALSPGALQLRTIQALEGLGSSSSNTIVMAIPVEVLNALKAVPELADALSPKKNITEL
jgi:regulator of protease activity HflC (stomatin/prohibitin superfamily)